MPKYNYTVMVEGQKQLETTSLDEAEKFKLAKEQEDQDTARQTQITKKASAITKLKALGLDDDEISALTGAS